MTLMAESTVSNSLERLFGLHGKTALVTGGGRGLGRGIAHALAQAGVAETESRLAEGLKRDPDTGDCPTHWQRLPLLPAKGEQVAVQTRRPALPERTRRENAERIRLPKETRARILGVTLLRPGEAGAYLRIRAPKGVIEQLEVMTALKRGAGSKSACSEACLQRGRRKIMKHMVLVLVASLFVLVGCGSPPGPPPSTGGGTSTLEVRVLWRESNLAAVAPQQRLLALLSPPVLAASSSQAAVGVRVIYPETGETYTLSASWNGVDEESVITIRVLPTNRAYVYAVGVAGGQAKWYRIPPALRIPEGGTVTVNLTETPPVMASWECVDETCRQAMAGSVTATGDRLSFYINVADPFQIGENPSWEAMLIRVFGKAWRASNPSGMRRFQVVCEREDGNTCSFQPYVAGPMFGMDTVYTVPPSWRASPSSGDRREVTT